MLWALAWSKMLTGSWAIEYPCAYSSLWGPAFVVGLLDDLSEPYFLRLSTLVFFFGTRGPPEITCLCFACFILVT